MLFFGQLCLFWIGKFDFWPFLLFWNATVRFWTTAPLFGRVPLWTLASVFGWKCLMNDTFLPCFLTIPSIFGQFLWRVWHGKMMYHWKHSDLDIVCFLLFVWDIQICFQHEPTIDVVSLNCMILKISLHEEMIVMICFTHLHIEQAKPLFIELKASTKCNYLPRAIHYEVDKSSSSLAIFLFSGVQ